MAHYRAAFTRELRLVELGLAEAARGSMASPVTSHLLGAGGKRLRPLLVLAAGRGSSDAAALVRAGVGIELLHLATLHHDDIVDEAGVRRGVPSVNSRYGNAPAAFAGGYLMARALEQFAELGDEVNCLAADAVAALWRGEMRQLERVGLLDVDESVCLEIARDKTGALYGLAARAGAYLGGATKCRETALASFGELLGTAFQLVDDVLDIVGDEGALGKPPGSDLREGVYSLPVAIALGLPAGDRLRALLAIEEIGASELAEARHLLLESGAIFDVVGRVRRLLATAVERLRAAGCEPHTRRVLSELAGEIEQRLPSLPAGARRSA